MKESGTIVVASDGKSISFNNNPSSYATTGSEGNTVSQSSPNSNTGGTVTNTAPIAPTEQGAIVYITDTGKKYHRSGCTYLSHSQHPISMQDAVTQGYTACKVCKP